jgi:TP901 family phage tail tape measure protein
MPSLPKTGVELIAQGLSDFLGDMKRAGRAVEDLGDSISKSAKGVGAFGEVMTGALRRVGEVGVEALADAGRAAAGFVAESVSAAGDVEQSLNVLQVAGRATDEQMAAVSQRAIALGSDLTLPATSAMDATTGMLELVKAGMSVDQAMEAAKGTLQLAAAAETDAATAAQVMAGALNAFQLPAEQAVHVTDLLAGAANASSANMTDLAQGFNQAAFAFNTVGFSADDLAVSLAVLTKNGLTGSDSGTALKNAIMRLIDPTDKAKGVMEELGFSAYDAQGVMKPWPQLISELQAATANLTPEMRNQALGNIFLSDGMKAMVPLLGLSKEGLAGMYTEVTASGQAAELAGAQMKGWNGAMAGLQSQVETLQLIIGQYLLPILTPLINKLAEATGLLAAGDYAGFFSKISEVAEQAVAQVTTFFRELGEGTSPISPFLDNMIRALEPLGQMLINTLGRELDKHMPALKEQLARWGAEAIGALGKALLDGIMFLGVSLGMWILEQEPHINKALNLWAAQFAGWVNNGIAQMLEDLGNVWSTLKNWFGEMAGNILHEAGQMGNRMIEGFGNAIQAGIGWVRDQAWNMANAAREAAMHALGIGSPSKVFEQIGAWTAEGMQMGVAAGTPAVQGAMTQMASPVAYPGAGGGSSTNVTNNRSVSMPIYTNQTPAALQQSWAIIQAVASGDI